MWPVHERFLSTRFWRIVPAGRCKSRPFRSTHSTAHGLPDGWQTARERATAGGRGSTGCRRGSRDWSHSAFGGEGRCGPSGARCSALARTRFASAGMSNGSPTRQAERTGNGPDLERPPVVRPADLVPSRQKTLTRSQPAHNLPAELPHAVLIDRLSQWIFNRDLLHSSHSAELQNPARARSAGSRGTTTR